MHLLPSIRNGGGGRKPKGTTRDAGPDAPANVVPTPPPPPLAVPEFSSDAVAEAKKKNLAVRLASSVLPALCFISPSRYRRLARGRCVDRQIPVSLFRKRCRKRARTGMYPALIRRAGAILWGEGEGVHVVGR